MLSVRRLVAGKLVYLCTPVDSASQEKPFVAKLHAAPYPERLHEELSRAGLAPALVAPVEKFPGKHP